MNNYKPQSPLIMNNQGIFPLTTYDQIILPDGSRWSGSSQEEIYIGSTQPEEKYDLWIDTSEEQAAMVRADSIMYIAFTIEPSQWTNISGKYIYSFNRTGISAYHAVFNLTLDEESQSNLSGLLNWETTNNTVSLITSEVPGGNITGYMMLLPVVDRTEG